MENINSVIHWNCFVVKPNAWILTVWFTSTKNKYPSSLHLYYGGCPCRRKDSPLSRNENVTKVLPTCSYFYFFIGIKKSWILLYKRTTCFKYLMRRSSHICTQIKKMKYYIICLKMLKMIFAYRSLIVCWFANFDGGKESVSIYILCFLYYIDKTRICQIWFFF